MPYYAIENVLIVVEERTKIDSYLYYITYNQPLAADELHAIPNIIYYHNPK